MIFEFKDCTFDEEICELRRGNEAIPLQPKVLDLLLYLIRHRDRVVSKIELLDNVWADATVGDGVLTRAVNLLRNAVGDAGNEQAVIRTLPRKGYRFSADVQTREGKNHAARTPALAEAIAAYEQRDWVGTLEALARAEEDTSLEAPELEIRAWSLLWSAPSPESTRPFEQAHAAYDEADDQRGAARMAIQLVRDFAQQNQSALAAGWFGRASALLESLEECEEHALFEWILSRTHFESGMFEKSLAHADRAVELARRVGSRDVEALGLLDRGHCLLAVGDVDEAVAIHDQIIAIAMGGGLGVQVTGTIYCSVIWGCRNRGDWERAGQLTDHSIRWCETAHVAQFPGLCMLHRAEVLRLQAHFEQAEREVLRACDDLLVSDVRASGHAFNELGEIRIRRGDLPGTRTAFRRAVELGMEPEPGLSRLRVVDGDIEGALKGLDRALSDNRLNAKERHVILLAAKIEAAIAGGQLRLARTALGQLEVQPDLWKTPAHLAEVEASRGRMLLSEGNSEEAIAALKRSRRAWLDIGANYEAARIQSLLALALEADGDLSAARLELEAAHDAMNRLGATLDEERAARRLAQLATRTPSTEQVDVSVRTFLFTDIVGSTRLVEVMGDADWETLRRWYHRTMQQAFSDHGGEVVGPHEGDGFFVAFVEASDAIACAVDIQRTLAAHREQHGFAPQVRIGAHTSESMRRGGDYSGKGVHIAARVADGAEPGAVSVTTTTLEASSLAYVTSEPRSFPIKNSSDVVDVADIKWR